MAKFSAENSCFAARICVMFLFGASMMFRSISALQIFTDDSVSLWQGRRNQSIPCYVRLDPDDRGVLGFSWSRHNMSNVFVKVFRDSLSVTGKGIESGNYSLSGNRSLVINRPVGVEDEGQYFCQVRLFGDPTWHYKSSTIRVLSAPNEPYPSIPECDRREAESDDNHHESGDKDNACTLKQAAGERLNLTCKVSQFRPIVDVAWKNGSRNVNEVHRTLVNNTDGTQSLSVTFELTASLGVQKLYCHVNGEAVVGGPRWSLVTVEGVEASESHLVLIIIIIVVVIAAVLLLLVIIIAIILKHRRAKKNGKKNGHQQLEAIEKGQEVTSTENSNHYTLEPVMVAVEETPPSPLVRLHEGTQTETPQHEKAPDGDSVHSSVASEQHEQKQELLEESEREGSQTTSRGHSRMSSRSDIAHHDFGQSWVCVDLKDLEKLEAAKNEEEAEAEAAKAAAGGSSAGAGPSEQHSQPEGTSVVGNLLETFHNFFKHDA